MNSTTKVIAAVSVVVILAYALIRFYDSASASNAHTAVLGSAGSYAGKMIAGYSSDYDDESPLPSLFLAGLLAFIPASIAKGKGRSFGLWWFYGWMLFIVALIHSLVMKSNAPDAKVEVD